MYSFPDQVHVERIAEALSINNASLMVGAGLSRNAQNIANPSQQMPTWSELGKAICNKLYPASDPSCARQRERALNMTNATSGSMRLAQEFEASFSRTELNRLLKNYTPDTDYAPSDLHRDLLRLQWNDVFTTNWDTLLERAADDVVHRRYDIVRTREDIPASQPPRIVKLHGSFPSNYPFIFSEEDYRSYPRKFTHFINMVQQSMMENLFCLVGFSGEDPNFLHWAGWVRDNLGESAPKIYMVGWLELAPVQRRMLEDHNIVPVDLSKLPQAVNWPEECRHLYALEWFWWTMNVKQLNFSWDLENRRPRICLEIDVDTLKTKEAYKEYQPAFQKTEKERLEGIRKQISYWKHDRENYDGWIIAPAKVRINVWTYTQNWTSELAKLAHLLPPWERLFALRELVWCLDVCLAPLHNDIDKTIEALLDSIDPKTQSYEHKIDGSDWENPNWPEARKAWIEVALKLLQNYREEGHVKNFETLASHIEDQSGCRQTLDAVHHHKARFALEQLDYQRLRGILSAWQTSNGDHIWSIRKAGIYFEIGNFDEAYDLIIETLPAIRRSMNRNGTDIPALSREGLAMQLLDVAFEVKLSKKRSLEYAQNKEDNSQQKQRSARVAHPDRPIQPVYAPIPDNEPTNGIPPRSPDWIARWDKLLVHDCDIREEWNKLCLTLEKEPPDPRQNRIIFERKFDAGRSSLSRHYGSGGQLLPAYQAIIFAEMAGMPSSISYDGGGYTVASQGLNRAATWLKDVDTITAIRSIIRTCNSEYDNTLNGVITREAIACLEDEKIFFLIDLLLKSVKQLSITYKQNRKLLDKLRVSMDILSRVVLRISDEDVLKRVFDLTVNLVNDPEIRGHHWWYGALYNLMKRTMEAAPKKDFAKYILPLLAIPTGGYSDASYLSEPWWNRSAEPELICSLRQEDPKQWTAVISSLLPATGTITERRRAIWRMTFLHHSNALNGDEQQLFAKHLWSKEFLADTGLPGNTDLYQWVFMGLPEPEIGQAEKTIRSAYLTKAGAAKLQLTPYLEEVGSILNVLREKSMPFALSTKENSVIKSKVKEWMIETCKPTKDPLGLSGNNDEITKSIGIAEILPAVTLTEKELDSTWNKVVDLESKRVRCFLIYPTLASRRPNLVDQMISNLSNAISCTDSSSAKDAIHSVNYWLSLAATNHAPPLPTALFEEICIAIYARREPVLAAALSAAAYELEHRSSASESIDGGRIFTGLEYLLEETEYDNAKESGLIDRVDVPLIRQNGTKLALALMKAGFGKNTAIVGWLARKDRDPLPEVRNLV